jgi:hypothetical protein
VLSAEEREYVIQQLEQHALSHTGNLRLTVTAPLASRVALRIPDLTTAQAYAREAVRVCVEDGWQEDPCSLYLLLALVPQDVKIASIRERIRMAPPPPANPLLATILFTDVPFVDRTLLRTKLQVLAGANAPKPILIVSGPTGSGKTYSAQYIDHFRASNPNLQDLYICPISFLRGTDLRALARDMVSLMGRSPGTLPEETTNKDRYPLEVANWVLTEAHQTTYRWWFVLDGFAPPEARDGQEQADHVPKEIRAFINFLADNLTKGVYRTRFRLILLGYERAHLTVTPGLLDLEPLQAASDAEIVDCARAILARLKPGANVQQQPLIAAVMHELPASHQRMAEANRRLTKLLESVEAINAAV